MATILCLVMVAIGVGLGLVFTKKQTVGIIGAGKGATIAVLSFVFIVATNHAWTEYLLHQSMGTGSVYLTRLSWRWILFGAGFLTSFGTMTINAFLAAKVVPEKIGKTWRIGILCFIGLAAAVFGLIASASWDNILLWLNKIPFGKQDPLFGVDIGWYVFSLPFLQNMMAFGFGLVVSTFVLTGGVYLAQSTAKKNRGYYYEDEVEIHLEKVQGPMTLHLGILAGIFILALAGYYLFRRAALPCDGTGFGYAAKNIQGGSWIDQHYTAAALIVMALFSLFNAPISVMLAFFRKWRALMVEAGAFLVVLFLVLALVPGLVHLFAIGPNELAMQSQYISWDNQGTLSAFGLTPDKLVKQNFPAENLTAEQVASTPSKVFNNIRLLDPFLVFLPNADQREEQRTYYDFLDPDIDYYIVNGEVQQVMITARELPSDQVPIRTWVNKHLVFTNGRGAPVAPVNHFDSEGNPVYLVRGIPGQGPLVPREEAIYYGEARLDWVITGSSEKEVGPPDSQGGWVEVEYQGDGGIQISGLRRFAFSLRFNDLTLLLSNRLTFESRLHARRNIQERVASIAPFLILDKDPYIVAGKDRFYWMWDAFTWAKDYPYSDDLDERPVYQIRYIRASVKIVMDAYSGVPTFYLVDPEDPVARIWASIFPDVFHDIKEMPEELRAHIRYPEEMFVLQAKALERHHMTDPRALYNAEDMWQVAHESSEGKIQETAPRFVYAALPGQESPEYLLVWSYTRLNKPNAVALIAARSSYESYGQIRVYLYPIGETIAGPGQVEQWIESDPQLGPQLTLLSQQGKEVIKGNIMTLLIGDSIIYVKPLYVKATAEGTGEGMPQLRFVVVGSAKERIAFGSTLEEAMTNYVKETSGESAMPKPSSGAEATTTTPDNCQQLWQKLEAAVQAQDPDTAARIAVEILVQCK